MPDKPIAQKLFIKEGYKVLIINTPESYESTLGELPENVTLLTKSTGLVDFIQVFLTSRKELEAQLPGLRERLKPKGLLWVSYPKGTSKMKADVKPGHHQGICSVDWARGSSHGGVRRYLVCSQAKDRLSPNPSPSHCEGLLL